MSKDVVSQSGSSGRVKGAEEILSEIRLELLECKVCFEMFSSQQNGRRPRNLPCGHVICLGCVCALAHPILRQLECPFCRRGCDVGGTYDSQALLDLRDLLDSTGRPRYFLSPFGSGESCSVSPKQASQSLGSGIRHLQTAFGGWGSIVNPTGVAVLGPMEVVVVHGGHEKVTIFNFEGHYRHSFGHYGHSPSEICHPLDVAVSPLGHILVTDAGDHSVKVFSQRGCSLASIGPFKLPWGIDLDNSGHVLVTDAQAGTVWQILMDFGNDVMVVDKRMILKNLQFPRAVASCRVSGNVVVLEAQRSNNRDSTPSTLKLFNKDFILLSQVDSSNLSPMSSVKIDLSYATFDKNGDVIVADVQQGLVWSLGDIQSPVLSLIVKDGLLRPVGLVTTEQNSLIVLDGGDHAVKIYSDGAEDSGSAKTT
ncbi:E3 ubiquitin-protein ligase NHLRC1-like [Hoplias malabaricus]|uniref:E3 ubiquitin-protein ligase NHLRC1-like n=1 Tax=Hoplias malabaricus TaxID=27720 RepID=UPI0034632BC0